MPTGTDMVTLCGLETFHLKEDGTIKKYDMRNGSPPQAYEALSQSYLEYDKIQLCDDMSTRKDESTSEAFYSWRQKQPKSKGRFPEKLFIVICPWYFDILSWKGNANKRQINDDQLAKMAAPQVGEWIYQRICCKVCWIVRFIWQWRTGQILALNELRVMTHASFNGVKQLLAHGHANPYENTRKKQFFSPAHISGSESFLGSSKFVTDTRLLVTTLLIHPTASLSFGAIGSYLQTGYSGSRRRQTYTIDETGHIVPVIVR